MYFISNKAFINKGKIIDKTQIFDLDGFPMGSSKKIFKIQGFNIHKIHIMNKKLANPLASKIVFQKYEELVKILTELLVEDDDSGDTCREVLNQIEKFRLEIKNKYRDYLLKKELEKMSKQLTLLQKEAKQKLYELQYNYLEYQTENRRSR